jgi:hypothetical protein
VINGRGNYAVEAETSNSMRMDIVVFFGGNEYVIELKIWHGKKRNEDALEQVVKYLKPRHLTEGYLLSFADTRKAPAAGGEIEHDGCIIYEEVVAYRDRETEEY